MIQTGLVSISFREKTPEELIAAVTKMGLDGIEWGSDVHVPPDQKENAKRIRSMMDKAGLRTFAYGSYYYAGQSDPAQIPALIECAKLLSAPVIRIWAGKKGSADAEGAYRQKVVEDTKRFCDLAAEQSLDVCYEFHPRTLTDCYASALQTVQAVDRPNLKLHWQPNFKFSGEDIDESLTAILPYLCHVHVFHWDKDYNRLPLADAQGLWKKWMGMIQTDGKDHAYLLEFILDDSLEQLEKDGAVLKRLAEG